MDSSQQIDLLRKDLLIQSINNELRFLDNNPQESTDKKTQLKTILEIVQKNNDTGKKDVDKMFDAVDKVIFKRSWSKLPPHHKIVKIKEYLINTIKNETLRTDICTELIKLVNTNKLNTKKHVIYDPVKECIESIPILKLEDNSFRIK